MKTFIVTVAAIFFAMNTISAQTEQTVKSDIKKVDRKEAKLRSEKRKDRITLRKLEGKEASYQSKQQFSSDFDNVQNVQWRRDNYFDVAAFTKNGKEMKAYYDFDAQLVGTVSASSFTDLPANAQKQIKKEYKDYTVDKVIFYDDNESNESDMLLYGAQFADEDSYFAELSGKGTHIVLHVTKDGNVLYFAQMK